jgi:hypothetical protein
MNAYKRWKRWQERKLTEPQDILPTGVYHPNLDWF